MSRLKARRAVLDKERKAASKPEPPAQPEIEAAPTPEPVPEPPAPEPVQEANEPPAFLRPFTPEEQAHLAERVQPPQVLNRRPAGQPTERSKESQLADMSASQQDDIAVSSPPSERPINDGQPPAARPQWGMFAAVAIGAVLLTLGAVYALGYYVPGQERLETAIYEEEEAEPVAEADTLSNRFIPPSDTSGRGNLATRQGPDYPADMPDFARAVAERFDRCERSFSRECVSIYSGLVDYGVQGVGLIAVMPADTLAAATIEDQRLGLAESDIMWLYMDRADPDTTILARSSLRSYSPSSGQDSYFSEIEIKIVNTDSGYKIVSLYEADTSGEEGV